MYYVRICIIVSTATNSTFSDISCTSVTATGIVGTSTNCKWNNIIASGTITVNDYQDSSFDNMRATNMNICVATTASTTVLRCQFSNLITPTTPGIMNICVSSGAFGALLTDCDFTNIHCAGTVGGFLAICTSSIAGGTAICLRAQFSTVTGSTAFICDALLASSSIMQNSQFNNLSILNSLFMARTQTAVACCVMTMTNNSIDNFFYRAALAVLNIGSRAVGSTWSHGQNNYNNLNILGATSTIRLSYGTPVGGGINKFSNANFAGTFVVFDSRLDVWSNIQVLGAISIGPATQSTFTNIWTVATGLALNIGGVGTGSVTDCQFNNIDVAAGVSIVTIGGAFPVFRSWFTGIKAVTPTINNCSQSLFSQFRCLAGLVIGNTTSCSLCTFTDFHIESNFADIIAGLADCVLSGFLFGSFGATGMTLDIGAPGLAVTDCSFNNFRTIDGGVPPAPIEVTIVNATNNRFTNCRFDRLIINSTVGVNPNNDNNSFENLTVVILDTTAGATPAADNRFTNLVVSPSPGAVVTTFNGARTQVSNSRFVSNAGAHSVTAIGTNCSFIGNLIGSPGSPGTLTLPVGSGTIVGNHAIVVGGLPAAVGLNTGAW